MSSQHTANNYSADYTARFKRSLRTATRSVMALSAMVLVACIGVPDDIEPVDNFDINQYLGTWYEVARLENSFEAGLSNVTAEYSLNDDGSVKVINRGYNDAEGDWEDITGKARFVEDPSIAHLKVSFFGPFYSSYVVFELGENYEYAFVTGMDKDFLWLLSRTPTVEPELLERFFETAELKNYNLDAIILIDQTRNIDTQD